MKIVKSTNFQPVSIVLESQDEVNWLYELTANIGGSGKVREFFDNIYYGLRDSSTKDEKVFEEDQSIHVKTN